MYEEEARGSVAVQGQDKGQSRMGKESTDIPLDPSRHMFAMTSPGNRQLGKSGEGGESFCGTYRYLDPYMVRIANPFIAWHAVRGFIWVRVSKLDRGSPRVYDESE